TPLTWGIAGTEAELGWRDALERFGAATHDEFKPDDLEVLGVFGGYCYLNVSVSRLMGVRTPGLTWESIDYSLFGAQPGVPPYEAHPSDENEALSERCGATLGFILTAESLPELLEQQAAIAKLRAERPDLTKLSDAELVARTSELYATWFRALFGQHLFVTYCSTVPAGILGQVAAAVGDPNAANRLISGIGDVDSAAPSWAMWELGRIAAGSAAVTAEFEKGVDGLDDRLRASGDADAKRFVAAFDDFLYEFGSRGPNEWEMRSPTWETRPELALSAIDRMRVTPEKDAPQRHNDAMAVDREALAATIAEQLAGDPETQGQFIAAVGAAKVFLAARERTKTTIIRMVHEARVCMRELGHRYVDAGHFDDYLDFGFVRNDELDALLADPGSFKQTIRERKDWYDELSSLDPTFVVTTGNIPPSSSWSRRDAITHEKAKSGEVLEGLPGCPGIATGRARVILDSNDPGALEPGDVLVAPITDPSWTPLFVPACAVVVDVGAQISHAIIVSRELGIPCVVSVTGGTKRIPDGATITVDGTAGTVTIH
ncbi:MAG: rifampicin phosphotransferase, partial [Actinomycetota bacterium]|nr:rifampicin phosphotransferase [Actinomycetota bacterium]